MMSRKPSERRNADEKFDDDLDLTPIMSILVILIPVLLFAFSFNEVRVQAVSSPRLGTGKANKKDDEKKPLNLTVIITSKGFKLTQQAELTTDPEKPIFKRVMIDSEAQDVETYDYPTLYSRVMAKKLLYPDETTINIGAEPHIPWKVIARTIDAVRAQLEKESYEKLALYEKAEAKTKKDGELKVPVDLFPAVVFTVVE
jgi:biopolymer transport protein ExbD